MYGVILEWDGNPPPSAYYHRVHRLGLYVHGDKDSSPVARRLSKVRQFDANNVANEINANTGGVINDFEAAVVVQEGFVLCGSMTLARLVASIAINEGAKLVKIGNVDFVADDGVFTMSDDDKRALARVESVFGRRGRPTKLKMDFVVTCHEEAMSFFVAQEREVVTCPHCGGVRIMARPSQFVPKFKPFINGDIADYWLASRFSGGYFEIPEEALDAPTPKMDDAFLNDLVEQEVAERVLQATWPKGLNNAELLDVMDASFCSLAYFTHDERIDSRMRAIGSAFRLGALPTSLSLLSGELPDLFDCSPVIHDRAAELHIKVTKKGEPVNVS